MLYSSILFLACCPSLHCMLYSSITHPLHAAAPFIACSIHLSPIHCMLPSFSLEIYSHSSIHLPISCHYCSFILSFTSLTLISFLLLSSLTNTIFLACSIHLSPIPCMLPLHSLHALFIYPPSLACCPSLHCMLYSQRYQLLGFFCRHLNFETKIWH